MSCPSPAIDPEDGLIQTVAYDLGDELLYVAEWAGEDGEVVTCVIPKPYADEAIRPIEL